MIEAFTEQQRVSIQGEIVGDIADECLDIARGQRGRNAADQHRGGAEAFERKAIVRQLRGAFLQPVAARLVEFDHFGQQQRLRGGFALTRPGRAQAFEHQPLVGGVLIDQNQAIFRLGDNIGLGDLAAGDAERVLPCIGGLYSTKSP